MKKFYLTTAIPYANAKPHIGTAMDYLYGDILLRYHVAKDGDALMSIGTDEHGTKVAEKAIDNGQTPQEFVDSLQPHFEQMRSELDLDFAHIRNVRTTDEQHIRRVQQIWQKLNDAGMIYKSTYEGWYCVGCESFVTESEARAKDFMCPDHNKPLEKLSEDNYYLAVSKYTEQIREFIKNSVTPEFRAKELLELIKDGAKDVSISRPTEKLAWGIPVPDDLSQVMYVWVDALSNYLTVIGYPEDDEWHELWPADVEVVGKDIARFHAIIWPAMLIGLGIDLPKRLMIHGFINVSGAKMSKSIGNVVSPLEIIDNYGVDAFRYYFARHIPTFDDGDFTWEKFEAAYNGELANDLGNLVSRVANMIKKYEIPSPVKDEVLTAADLKSAKDLHDEIDSNFAGFEINQALEKIWRVVQNNNKFIDDTKPWTLAKTDREKLVGVMQLLWLNLQEIASLLKPFIPQTSDKISAIFADNDLPGGIPILFPKKYLHTPEPTKK